MRLTRFLSASALLLAAPALVAGCGGDKSDGNVLPDSVTAKAFCDKLDVADASAFTAKAVTSFANAFADNVYSCAAKPGDSMVVAIGVPTRTMAEQRKIATDQKATVAAVPGVPAEFGIYNEGTDGNIFVMLFIGDNAVQCSWAGNPKGKPAADFGNYCVDQAKVIAK